MNAKPSIALATLALAASFGARAQEATPDTWMKPAQASTHAAGEHDAYANYRRTVLGDSSALAAPLPQAAQRIEERVEPGPYARQLMYLGQNREQAIADARTTIGEVATRRVVQVTQRSLSAAEKYDRLLGRAVAPERIEQTLSFTAEAPATAATN